MKNEYFRKKRRKNCFVFVFLQRHDFMKEVERKLPADSS